MGWRDRLKLKGPVAVEQEQEFEWRVRWERKEGGGMSVKYVRQDTAERALGYAPSGTIVSTGCIERRRVSEWERIDG